MVVGTAEHDVKASGLLAAQEEGGEASAWVADDPSVAVASLKTERHGNAILVSADGPVHELVAPSMEEVLGRVGDRLGAETRVRSIPPGWSSWSAYFRGVTDGAIAENLAAAERLALAVDIVQVDDGWELDIGDWLDASPRFGSLEETARRIVAAGKTPGIWTAPFLVGERSRLAREHPDWLVDAADAGWNWEQRLRVLDVTHPAAADYLTTVYRSLTGLGFGFHKLDFLFAGAFQGISAYREGIRLIASATDHAILLGCGAPLLPSVGLFDAMRVGPDVIGEDAPTNESTASIEAAIATTSARAWMHGRLWCNDTDHLLARPEISTRETWSQYVAAYGGLVLSSDRLAALDDRGIELTRAALRPSSISPHARSRPSPGSPPASRRSPGITFTSGAS